MSNIAQRFFDAAARRPVHVALVQGEHRITYGALADEVRAYSAHLLRKGIAPGDRVVVFVPMGIDLYRTVLALFSIGAVAVFLDAWVDRRRMETCCAIAEPRGFIGSHKALWLSLLSGPLRRIPLRLGTSFAMGGGPDPTAVDPDHTALITFTTGSTGTPKAARRSHAFLAAQFQALLEEVRPTPDDVALTTLPIVLLMDLGVGCTTVVPSFSPARLDRFPAARIADEMRRHGVDRFSASPAQAEAVARAVHGKALPALRRIFTGGAPVFPRMAATIRGAFPQAACRVVYGSTEAEPIASIDAPMLLKEHASVAGGLCVGRPAPCAEVRIIGIVDGPIDGCDGAAFASMCLAPGSVGEIVVAGPHVLGSYHNDEEAFRRNKLVVDGRIWHRTGDAGMLDADGLLHLCGRCAQVFQRDGAWYFPFVWEDRLADVPGVACGTIAVINGLLVAVVEKRTNVHPAQVAVAVTERHPELDAVRVLKRIPRDPRHRSKIDHGALLKMLGAA